MSLVNKILVKLNLKDENHWNDKHVSKYCTDMSWSQDSGQSIVASDGRYDLKRFSQHEVDTIKHVLNVVNKKYPVEYRSIGLANESYTIKYKARYVLFEMIVLMYSNSESYIDRFAVSLAYESKGAYFRKQAIEYFDSSEPFIETDFMREFVSYMPLHVYSTFAKLYEQECDYDNAIYCTIEAKKWSFPGNQYFRNRVNELLEKKESNPQKRSVKMSEKQAQFENDVTIAAKYFIEHDFIPKGVLNIQRININISEQRPEMKPEKKIDIEQYAVMCNAYLDHQDQKEQYNIN